MAHKINKRGQLFHWVIFVILIAVLVIFSLNPPEKEHFRGEIVSKLLTASKDAELEYIYNSESANLQLKQSILDLASKAGFDEQICGSYKNISVVRADCLPDYISNLKAILESKSGNTISLESREPITIIADNKDIIKNIEISSISINVPENINNTEAVTTPKITKYSLKYRLTGLRRRNKVDRIILHHSGDRSAGQTYNGLKSRGLSVHYILDKDGTVYYVVDESLRAAHAYGFNDRSIGIEIVNRGTKDDTFTDAQYAALKLLLKDITARWPGISYDSEHIMGHYQTSKIVCDNPKRYHISDIGSAVCGKWDPSPNFDWQRIGLNKHITVAELGLTVPKEMGYT